MGIIEFSEVTKTYGRPGQVAPALEQVSFTAVPGEFVLLMGPSGAGKSTLLKLILAMERPETGTIRVAGRNVHRLTKGSIPYLRRNLGAVFQDFKLLDEATPLENVSLALQVLGLPVREVRERAREALGMVRVDPELRKPVRRLSGGEQQRVALARALAGRPPILLADEPTGNLDPDLTMEILAQLTEIQRGGTTIVLATHDPVVKAHATATRFLHLQSGRLIDDVLTPAGRAITGEEAAVPEPQNGASPSDSAAETATGQVSDEASSSQMGAVA